MEALKKALERQLNWYGHAMRREKSHIINRTLQVEAGARRKAEEAVEEGLYWQGYREKPLFEEDTRDKNKQKIQNMDPLIEKNC